MKTHKDLIVYKESMALIELLYRITSEFPENETFGLVKQMRRSAVSIPSNISEGAVRKSTKEFIRFLYIALGSLTELETQIEISGRIGYLKHNTEVTERIVYIRRMLINLIKSLSKKKS